MKQALYVFLILLLFSLPFILSYQNRAERRRMSTTFGTNAAAGGEAYAVKARKESAISRFLSSLYTRKGARVAIILDDAGGRQAYQDKIRLLSRSITISFLPNMPGVKETAREYSDMGFPVIAHIPFEPFDPGKMEVKDIFLLTTDNQKLLQLKMDLYIDQNLPFIRGCNNHMGSAFTSDRDAMERFVEIVKRKKLFFIDSWTSETSIAYEIMRDHGVPTARNSIFLDNKNNYTYISSQFERGIRKARRKGKAIMIGHITMEATIDVLLDKVAEYEERISFVPVEDLVE
ncbi:divergent polysaccharide deacetylase family protein [Spirochaetota bacterium]